MREVYEIGKKLPLPTGVKSIDYKLSFMLFPYDSKAVINTSLIFLAGSLFIGFLLNPLAPFVAYVVAFLGIVASAILFLYPTNIYYNHRLGEYNEEMLKAILRMSTFISMDTSIEYAFFEAAEHLHGTLKLQFLDIKHMIERKQKMTLGDAMDKYVNVWNKINPVFVKSLRLLQTAALSKKEDREAILEETKETLLLNYTTMGKRFSEELTNNAKKLVSAGILFPIMALMLIPLMTIFLPEWVKPSVLAFLYVVFFPVITLLMAMNFSAKRVQVDTIRITDSYDYKPMPGIILLISISIGIIFAIPTLIYVARILNGTAGDADNMMSLFIGWLISAGIIGGVYLYSKIYENRYRKLWSEVYDVERDLPHLLQSFSTYLTLNLSTENVIPEVINDYVNFGFGDHPVVKAFKRLILLLKTSKQSINQVVKKKLKHLLPSRKVVQIIDQIISFSSISQKASAKVSKMIREQTISIYKLDDYMKTLLAESTGLINITISMLAPLLCASAVIMSMAIVKSLVYITQQLEMIASIFGTGENLGFSLVNTSNIISPIFVEVIIGIYLVEIIIILSYFGTTINTGNDEYRLFQAIKNNIIGFVIYSVILFGGYWFIIKVFFNGILGVGT